MPDVDLERCDNCGEPTPDDLLVEIVPAPEWADNERWCRPCAYEGAAA